MADSNRAVGSDLAVSNPRAGGVIICGPLTITNDAITIEPGTDIDALAREFIEMMQGMGVLVDVKLA